MLLLFGILPEVTPSRSKRVAMNTVVEPKSIALHVEAERCSTRTAAADGAGWDVMVLHTALCALLPMRMHLILSLLRVASVDCVRSVQS